MKVLIPAAGRGSRFEKVGYTFPKPLIDVNGKPMIARVVENLYFNDTQFIFLVQKNDIIRYNLNEMLTTLVKNATVIGVNGITDGAACTALLAREYIDCDDELLIANSDQIIDFSKNNFNILRNWTAAASIVFAFNAVHPKWSFAKLSKQNHIIQIAEKKPISNVATCGAYYFRTGKLFVDAVDAMIANDDRVNNEFYIAPAINYINGYKAGTGNIVLPFFVDRMHGLGTPEDLENYLRNH